MTELPNELKSLHLDGSLEKYEVSHQVEAAIRAAEYPIAEVDTSRPWGGFFRLENSSADTFIREFFPGLDPVEARLGNPLAELSPKILLVAPEQRLSYQYHYLRAERWAFLTDAGYHKSQTSDPGELIQARVGDVVQFDRGERHRLVGATGHYALVAEIWQHVDPTHPSSEADIVREQDDYSR